LLDLWPASGRSTNCGDAAKPGAMEILQYGQTGPRALENADHKNAIVIFSPKSHTQSFSHDLVSRTVSTAWIAIAGTNNRPTNWPLIRK
jgi:hypothetical protein